MWGGLVWLTKIGVPYPPLPRKRSSIIERGGSHLGRFGLAYPDWCSVSTVAKEEKQHN
jgi:hypothetical protein